MFDLPVFFCPACRRANSSPWFPADYGLFGAATQKAPQARGAGPRTEPVA